MTKPQRNVMGATKRVAEQIVQEIADLHDRNFVAVRFGNVLGSRGSVVPTFLNQILAGGPVMVTHPEMRRYFMTIPEAVALVLRRAPWALVARCSVLDMGEPVRIVALATDMIGLSGLTLGEDIEIRFSGVRPGEKLYEELFFSEENAERTEHPKVLRAKYAPLPFGLAMALDALVVSVKGGVAEEDLIALLQRLVPDFRPQKAPLAVDQDESEASLVS
jgi:FlaA1/EpsC-like NDP-sugar epimerase